MQSFLFVLGFVVAVILFLILIFLLIRYRSFCRIHRHMDHMEDLRDRLSQTNEREERDWLREYMAQRRYRRAIKKIRKEQGLKPVKRQRR